MIIKLLSAGKSFKGLGQYLTHDAGTATAERVAWTHTLNCANDHVPSAIHEMVSTSLDAELLKAEAGIRKGGRPLENTVKHLSLNWHPDETPDRAHMIGAAESYLAHMGWEEHQALLVCHTDKTHPHVHVMLNAVHPETGCKLDDSLEKRRSQAWALAYEQEQGRIHCTQRLDPVEEREPAPTRPAWMAMKEAEQAQQHIDTARMAAEQAREAAHAPRMSPNEEWRTLKADQKAERIAFFEDGRDAFRDLRKAVFQEVREEFREEWSSYYAARRDGLAGDALQALKDDLVARQDAVLKERRDAACDALRTTRDATYADLLQGQRDERAELTARQAVCDNALATMRYEAANTNQQAGSLSLAADASAGDARESTPPAAQRAEPVARHADMEERTEAGGGYHGDSGVRDGVDIATGLGLGAMGGAAALVERLFDGFLGGSAKPPPANDHAPRPEPRAESARDNPFARAAAEAQRAAARAEEEAARDAWWDERRSRARD